MKFYLPYCHKEVMRFLSICRNPKDDSGKNAVSLFRVSWLSRISFARKTDITNSINSVQCFENCKENVKVYPLTTLLRKVRWKKFRSITQGGEESSRMHTNYFFFIFSSMSTKTFLTDRCIVKSMLYMYFQKFYQI